MSGDRYITGGLFLLAGIFASFALLGFGAWACVHESGAFAVYCGNAKGRALALQGLPALAGSIGGAFVMALSGRFRSIWMLAAALLAATTAVLLLIYFVADPPPGFGPG
jgi:hypothetical protein